MFDKILLAVDGSDFALDAAKVAGNLSRAAKSASLRVLTVYDSVPGYLQEGAQQDLIAAHMKECESILKAALKRIGDIPGEIETDILSGSPAEKIIEVAIQGKYDLVVMGSRGKGRLMGLLLGSHIHKVATHAPCPVLIVR